MKYSDNRIWLGLLAGIAAFALLEGYGLAAEDAKTWRATYDIVMMWVNFSILAFLIVKYGRKPLIRFLEGESRKTAEDLQRGEENKQQMDRRFQETVDSLDDSRKRIDSIRERILREGERRKQEIIESARRERQLMLERTRQKIDTQIAEAQLRLKRELVDRAVAIALERLPAEITAEEQLRLVDRFLRETQSS
jgi:F-type H+-transporting ATPase subunit b